MTNLNLFSQTQDQAQALVAKIKEGHPSILVTKPCQSGKTSVAALATKEILETNTRKEITAIFFLVSKASIELTRQQAFTIYEAVAGETFEEAAASDPCIKPEDIYSMLRDYRVYIEVTSKKLAQCTKYLRHSSIKRCVFILDETHTHDTQKNLDNLINSVKARNLTTQTVYITATPGVDGVVIPEEATLRFESGYGYVGIGELQEKGYIEQIDSTKHGIMNDNDLSDQVITLVDKTSEDNSNVAIIRTPKHQDVLKDLCPNIRFYNCDSHHEWEGLQGLMDGSLPAHQPTIILIKQGLSIGVTIHPSIQPRIVGVYETSAANEASIIQGLPGRCCGYNKQYHPDLTIYCEMSALANYTAYHNGNLDYLQTTGTPKAGCVAKPQTVKRIVTATYEIFPKTPKLDQDFQHSVYRHKDISTVRIPNQIKKGIIKTSDNTFHFTGKGRLGATTEGFKDNNNYTGLIDIDLSKSKSEANKKGQRMLIEALRDKGFDVGDKFTLVEHLSLIKKEVYASDTIKEDRATRQ